MSNSHRLTRLKKKRIPKPPPTTTKPTILLKEDEEKNDVRNPTGYPLCLKAPRTQHSIRLFNLAFPRWRVGKKQQEHQSNLSHSRPFFWTKSSLLSSLFITPSKGRN